MKTSIIKCVECGAEFNLPTWDREPTFADLKKMICPKCGKAIAFILPANRSFTRTPENRAKQSAATAKAWATHRAILERAGLDVTNELHMDYGTKTPTYRALAQMLRRINLDSGKSWKEWIHMLEFDPWGAHKALVTPAVYQYAFGMSVESAALCWRLFKVRVSVGGVHDGES